MYPVPIWAPILTKPDPTLRLDWQFATDRAFAVRRGPTPTFTRTTTATYEDSTGILRTAAVNEPRIDFDPTTLACSGLLLEESRTNLCIHSENLSAANWGKSNVSVTTDSATAPTGLLTADLLSETAASGFHTITIPSFTPAAGTTYSISAFFKKGPGATAPDWLILGLSNQFPASVVAFNVTTGAFGAVTGSSFTYRAIAYPNGWWRVVIVVTASGSSATAPLTVYFSNNTNTASAPSYLGQTTSNVLVWGAQVEVGAFPTSYIPTTTASVPRGADVLEITGANFSNLWNQPEGTLVLEMQKAYSVTSATSQINYLSANDGTLSNYAVFCQRGQGTTGEVFRVEALGASQSLMAVGSVTGGNGPINAINTPFRIGGAYKANDFAAAINGSDCSTDSTGSIPTLTQLQFPTVLSANHIRSLQYYSVRKTNAELTRLTQLSTLDPALTLDLQFALDATYFSRRGPTPAFTRLTSGSFVGSDGLIKTAAVNTPRIEYDPITRQCLGLLIEEQRQSLMPWSEDLTQATWTKVNVTATANQTVAPDGNSSADLVAETTVSGQHYINQQAVSITSGTTYTYSVFLKKGTGATAPDWVSILMFTGFGTKNIAFNVSTGAFGSSAGGLTGTAKQYPSGWWRISVSAAAISTGNLGGVYICLTNNVNTASAPTYPGQTTSDIFVWGAQFEAGFFASSYIQTTTVPFTRSAEVCDITAAAFTRFYNQTDGTVVVKFDRPSLAVSGTQLAIDDNTVNERIINIFSSGVERFSIVDTGGTTLNMDVAAITPVNTPGAHAGRIKLNDFAFSVNGSSPVLGPTQTVPTVTQMTLGYRNSANYGNGHIRAIQYYIVGKTNAQLQTLSTP